MKSPEAPRAILWSVKRSIVSVPVRRAGSQASGKAPSRMSDQDLLAVEEPLQIRLGDHDLAITMRTPGENSITVTLSGEASVDLSAQTRHFYLTSSCGCAARHP